MAPQRSSAALCLSRGDQAERACRHIGDPCLASLAAAVEVEVAQREGRLLGGRHLFVVVVHPAALGTGEDKEWNGGCSEQSLTFCSIR